jgi:predicted phosphodiesterase
LRGGAAFVGLSSQLPLVAGVTADDCSLNECPVRFAVLGDRTGGHVPGIHAEIIEEIERLKPDFVMTVGDMIEGYGADTGHYMQGWRDYNELVARLSMPVYITAGNNDITYDVALEPFRKMVGEPYRSLTVRNVHLIILDNSRIESPSEWPSAQLDWLIGDLTQHAEARQTIVFFHKPFWHETIARGEPDTLHSLFVKYGVDAVFSGHYHRFFSSDYDGIKYTNIGSSGAHLESQIAGLGYHYGWVTVTDSSIDIALLNKGSVRPWSLVSVEQDLVSTQFRLHGAGFDTDAPVSDSLVIEPAQVHLIVRNLHPAQLMTDTVTCHIPNGWTVEPDQQAEISFPWVEEYPYTVTRTLPIGRQAACRFAGQPVVIDGILDETAWSEPQETFFTINGERAAIEPTSFYFAYDAEALYMAARCMEPMMDSLKATAEGRDAPLFGDDCVGLFIQADSKRDTAYQVYVSAIGTLFDQQISVDEDGYYDGTPAWNGDVLVATRRDDMSWTVELRIPFASVGVDGPPAEYARVNFRRKHPRLGINADWQTPIEYNPRTWGRLVFRR